MLVKIVRTVGTAIVETAIIIIEGKKVKTK